MSLSRLQKIISESGLLSRRKADSLIKQGRVTLNGRKAIIGEKADPLSDHILVDGKDLPDKVNYKVILLNKPPGIISSCKDNHGRETILSLIPEHLRHGIHPVGRLDSYSRGAILLTNNGELTLRLTHPKYSHTKTYLVWVSGQPSQLILDNWRKGISLDGKMTMPATIKVKEVMNNKTLLKVTMKEGRNRQIRKLAAIFGHPVKDLQRIAIANIKLNGLQEGKWRELNSSEWISILN
ncbi:pseudouridine synthase [Prochlorococcus marinus]|uniref:Pseudouridine synthase n=1 Tax=Prochlorococcus marinus XMU1408 TaxID=2213228 RepID=A0A318R296_PROMR|nr:pseudouridine synthase [Prochlorococcus marinus]MBW3042274.1 pseudouridine synthase [Prochlorococcus marinus str. XMU1408]PYE01662.1 pseudouridine synthase [Prochlorococcus marinus XMU1408]